MRKLLEFFYFFGCWWLNNVMMFFPCAAARRIVCRMLWMKIGRGTCAVGKWR